MNCPICGAAYECLQGCPNQRARMYTREEVEALIRTAFKAGFALARAAPLPNDQILNQFLGSLLGDA